MNGGKSHQNIIVFKIDSCYTKANSLQYQFDPIISNLDVLNYDTDIFGHQIPNIDALNVTLLAALPFVILQANVSCVFRI